jgi:hypothetical protein
MIGVNPITLNLNPVVVIAKIMHRRYQSRFEQFAVASASDRSLRENWSNYAA